MLLFFSGFLRFLCSLRGCGSAAPGTTRRAFCLRSACVLRSAFCLRSLFCSLALFSSAYFGCFFLGFCILFSARSCPGGRSKTADGSQPQQVGEKRERRTLPVSHLAVSLHRFQNEKSTEERSGVATPAEASQQQSKQQTQQQPRRSREPCPPPPPQPPQPPPPPPRSKKVDARPR